MDSADNEVPGLSTRYRRYSKEFQKMINTRELDWIDEYNENILFHKNIKNDCRICKEKQKTPNQL